MDNNQGMMSCTIGTWLVALLAGILAAVLLMVLGGWSFMQAAFIGAVLFVVAGALISLILCRPLPPIGEASTRAPQEAAPAPAPKAETAKPAPAKPAAATAAPAAAEVKPSKPLPGQDDLAARKGEWKYEGEAAEAPKPAPAKRAAAKKAPAKAAAPAPEGTGTKPETLSAAREGGPDDLKQIKGVGPKLEALLHSMGFYHFDQVGNWGADEVAWVDQNLQGFKGRVSRDNWVDQAKILAEGGTTEFSSKVKKGGVY